MAEDQVHGVATAGGRDDIVNRSEGGEQHVQRMRADVPQRSFLAPPRRLAERVPGPEDRAQPGRRRAVQLTRSPHVVDPTLHFRPEMRRMEDERGYLSAP